MPPFSFIFYKQMYENVAFFFCIPCLTLKSISYLKFTPATPTLIQCKKQFFFFKNKNKIQRNKYISCLKSLSKLRKRMTASLRLSRQQTNAQLGIWQAFSTQTGPKGREYERGTALFTDFTLPGSQPPPFPPSGTHENRP